MNSYLTVPLNILNFAIFSRNKLPSLYYHFLLHSVVTVVKRMWGSGECQKYGNIYEISKYNIYAAMVHNYILPLLALILFVLYRYDSVVGSAVVKPWVHQLQMNLILWDFIIAHLTQYHNTYKLLFWNCVNFKLFNGILLSGRPNRCTHHSPNSSYSYLVGHATLSKSSYYG
jgi:hypothetical protein